MDAGRGRSLEGPAASAVAASWTHPVVNEETAAHHQGSTCSSKSRQLSISSSFHALISCFPAASTCLLSHLSRSSPLPNLQQLLPSPPLSSSQLSSPSPSQFFSSLPPSSTLLLVHPFSCNPNLLSPLSSTTLLSGSADPEEQEHLTMCTRACECVPSAPTGQTGSDGL